MSTSGACLPLELNSGVHLYRFGDVLSHEQCKQLVQALRKTVSWHCCAHGRPTIVPLVDLAHLQSLLQMRGRET